MQRGVNRAADRLHIVFDAQQEAGDQLAALLFAAVQESGRRRLEAAGQHFFQQRGGQRTVALRQRQRHHAGAIGEILQVAFAVEGFQRIAGKELPGAEKGLETVAPACRLLKQLANEFKRVSAQHRGFVIAFFDQIAQARRRRAERHAVGQHMLQIKLARRLTILIELDMALRVIQVKHGVKRVVIGRDGRRR